MWKAGSFLLFLGSALTSFLASAQPWCPVQIGTALYVSTGPVPGVKASAQAVSATWDPPGITFRGVYNMDRAAMSPLFGAAFCIDGTAASGMCVTDAQMEGVMYELDLTTQDQLCPTPVKHTMRFSAHFGPTESTRITGGAERTECGLGIPDGHGHCVVNTCVAGTVAASATYSLGLQSSNSNTSSCILSAGNPCEVSWQATGESLRRLVGGQVNYFQAGKYIQTGKLCTTNAGPPPSTVASVPSDQCASGFNVYVDPSTSIARCVAPGTGTPNPGDGTGAGAGGSGWPSSCPSWMSTICGWFDVSQPDVEAYGAQKGSINNSGDDKPQTFGDSAALDMAGQKFLDGRDTRFDRSKTCPNNPSIEMPGGAVFYMPFEKVCEVADMVYPVSQIVSMILAIGIALGGRQT